MTASREQLVGQIHRPGQKPENVALTLKTRPNLTEAEAAAGIQWIDNRYEPGNVKRYGATGDGTTDDTAAIQRGVVASESSGGALFFPPTADGYVSERVDIVTGGIKIHGDHTLMIHKYDTITQGSGGAGSTKAWPIFMVYRDADYTEICGFNFTSDSSIATAQSSLSGWESYLSHIVVHNADNIWIHHNRFAGTQPRAIFFHGGNEAKIHSNMFEGQGLIVHVGYEQNQNFWDAGANDQTTWYSPQSPNIYDNHFDSYVGVSGFHVIFLSGCIGLSLKDNKITNMAQSGADGIRIYSNDLGLTDDAGATQLTMGGEVSGNVIEGTFGSAMTLNGYSSSATSQVHQMKLEIHGNTIIGTGTGLDCERVNLTNIHHNQIATSASPLEMTRDITDTKINDNHFECTSAGNNLETFWTGSTLDLDNTTIDRNIIISPAGDQFILNVTAGDFDNASVSHNKVSVATTVANPLPFNIDVLSGTFRFTGNEFVVTGSSMADDPLFAFDGSADCEVNDNRVVSSSVQLDRSVVDGANITARGNTIPGLNITTTGKVFIKDNILVGATSSTSQPIRVDSATWLSIAHNYIESPVSLSVATVLLIDCVESRLVHNYIEGDSSAPLVRNDTSGDLKYWGNEQINNGSGGVTYTTNGSATAAAETGT